MRKRGKNSSGKNGSNRIRFGRPIRGGIRTVKNPRSTVKHVEHAWRRRFPLRPEDRGILHAFIREQVRLNRKGFKTFIVGLNLSVLGGLYQMRFRVRDEDVEWEQQWVSTPGSTSVVLLLERVDHLLDEIIPHQLRRRPAWINRVRVTFYRSE